MNIHIEGDLWVDFPPDSNAKRPKDELYPGSWKDVDFIIEMKDRYIFLEIKDPEQAKAKPHSERIEFINSIKTGKEDQNLCYKFKDTYLNEWLIEELTKPIYYYVIIALESLTSHELLVRTNCLKSMLPVKIPLHCKWIRPLAVDCIVFKISTWNHRFPDFPIKRISKANK
jgi:hypothetical protein